MLRLRTIPVLALLSSLAACTQQGAGPDNNNNGNDIPTKNAAASQPSQTAAIPPVTAVAPAPLAPSAEPKSLPAPLDVAAAPSDAQKTASGLTSKVLAKGTGKDHPGAEDTVKVHYTGWTK